MNISYSDLREISNAIDNICTKIKDNFTNIENSCNALFNNSEWEGNSAAYFQEKFASLSSNFEEATSELKQSVQYLRSVCLTYENVDQNIVNSFSGLV